MINNEKQFHIKCKSGDVGKYVILTGDPKRCINIAKYFSDYYLIADNREFITYTGFLDGIKVSVTSTGIGGPSAAIAVEELSAIGAEYFIRVGTCGGISLNVKGGDIIIPTGAIRQEGTTMQYIPIEYPAVADFDVIAALKKAAKDLKATEHTGIIQSKDSFYGQHSPERMPVSYELKNKWEAWKKAGVLGSEMECASIYTVASILGKKTGAVLAVIWNQERRAMGYPDEEMQDTDLAVRIAVESIKNLIKKEEIDI
ncbi:MAG: udp [Clostridia bacterium]|nr:udp [Clostridia bacterium]